MFVYSVLIFARLYMMKCASFVRLVAARVFSFLLFFRCCFLYLFLVCLFFSFPFCSRLKLKTDLNHFICVSLVTVSLDAVAVVVVIAVRLCDNLTESVKCILTAECTINVR